MLHALAQYGVSVIEVSQIRCLENHAVRMQAYDTLMHTDSASVTVLLSPCTVHTDKHQSLSSAHDNAVGCTQPVASFTWSYQQSHKNYSCYLTTAWNKKYVTRLLVWSQLQRIYARRLIVLTSCTSNLEGRDILPSVIICHLRRRPSARLFSHQASRLGAIAHYTVLCEILVKYRKWPFLAPNQTKYHESISP
jgi:hypothetical protein